MEPEDLLPAKPPYLPLPKGLVDYLSKISGVKKVYKIGAVVTH